MGLPRATTIRAGVFCDRLWRVLDVVVGDVDVDDGVGRVEGLGSGG